MTIAEISVALVGGGALATAVAELVARAWIRARAEYFVLKPHTTTILEIDKETLPSLQDTVRLSFNRDGERGDEPPKDWSDTFRVLVAGGSAAECYLLDQDGTWPAVIQQELARKAPLLGAERVHVGSIARSLVACEYLELMLRRVLPRYERLDLVILMVGASDVVHWLEKKTPRKIEQGELSVDYVFDEHPEGPFGWTLNTMALRQVLSRWHKRFTRPVSLKTKVGKTIARNRAMRARARTVLNITPDPSPMLESFEANFRRMVETARSHAKRVIVVRQPWFAKRFTAQERRLLWNFGAGRPYVEEVTLYYAHGVVNELLTAVDRSAARIAQELGVEQLDLMPLLDRSFETYYDYLHFTPKGARDVGRAVAQAILAGTPTPPGTLPAGTRCDVRLRATVESWVPRLERIGEAAAGRPLAPGKWSPKKVVGHMIDSAVVNLERFLRARDGEDLIFPAYPQDDWAEGQGYDELPWTELLGLWRLLNLHVARTMERTPKEVRELKREKHNLDVIAWGSVPADEPATLGYLMDDYVDHLEHHLKSLG